MSIEEFGKWLLDQMIEKNLNCLQLAKMAGMSHVTIGYYITGTSSPTFWSLKQILDALGKKIIIVDKEENQ